MWWQVLPCYIFQNELLIWKYLSWNTWWNLMLMMNQTLYNTDGTLPSVSAGWRSWHLAGTPACLSDTVSSTGWKWWRWPPGGGSPPLWRSTCWCSHCQTVRTPPSLQLQGERLKRWQRDTNCLYLKTNNEHMCVCTSQVILCTLFNISSIIQFTNTLWMLS